MTLDAPKINETLDGKFGKGRGLLMLLLPPPRFPCLATAHTLTFLRAADQRQQRCERWAAAAAWPWAVHIWSGPGTRQHVGGGRCRCRCRRISTLRDRCHNLTHCGRTDYFFEMSLLAAAWKPEIHSSSDIVTLTLY